MTKEHYFCVARPDGVPCNYPIGVVKDKRVDYTDDDPKSPGYGNDIASCPGCGRPLVKELWSGVDPDVDLMLALKPEPME